MNANVVDVTLIFRRKQQQEKKKMSVLCFQVVFPPGVKRLVLHIQTRESRVSCWHFLNTYCVRTCKTFFPPHLYLYLVILVTAYFFKRKGMHGEVGPTKYITRPFVPIVCLNHTVHKQLLFCFFLFLYRK